MEFISDYLVVIVTAICLCVGYVIKHIIPNGGANRYIPLIMAVLTTVGIPIEMTGTPNVDREISWR